MKKILVIDDDIDILEAVEILLETSGYDFEGTSDHEKIFEKIEAYQPDLIILDVLLSGNDGRVICKKIKEINSMLPIIMMSAHPAAKDTVPLCGADDFVPKPFEIDNLLTKVKSLLN